MSEKVADVFPASNQPPPYVQLQPPQVKHPSRVQPPPYPGEPLPVQNPPCRDQPPPYPGQTRVRTDYVPGHSMYSLQPQQSQQHSNAVVSLQSATAPTPVVIPPQTDAPTYFILSFVTFMLCSFFGALIFMFCAAAAIFCSLEAQGANQMEGGYKKARAYGRAALICNILVYILYILAVIVVGIVLAVVMPWEQSTSSVPGSDTSDYDYYNYYVT